MPDNALPVVRSAALVAADFELLENSMAYTVKQLAAISGVSIRTLHFYDETGLLAPAYHGANGYRFYEEPQLLTLQQILFYRELGFELKQIKQMLGRADFENIAALRSHRQVLEQSLKHTHQLLETIDKTIEHLEGKKKMSTSEMFAGFSIAAGDDRFGEHIRLGGPGGEPNDCKVSSQDTNGGAVRFRIHRLRRRPAPTCTSNRTNGFIFWKANSIFSSANNNFTWPPAKACLSHAMCLTRGLAPAPSLAKLSTSTSRLAKWKIFSANWGSRSRICQRRSK